ncbi:MULTISPECIES: CheR family methyltransferase [Sphingobium]|uniref:CheR family methyltransferase n=1 Tax=Sphingobium TaxID=165695 RepID=UPI0015EC1582|nr:MULTISPECIES: protein-glutamate O-methyltransferase CheR [Sphingobium]MCW2363348.1 chemotaxis protein methyltransferase CheR [Sphingobium sp. B10D3B]MCW2403253.1 chemotaxis protein methyltransferase CheR [Sphingobium sp. B10D7B]MCW2410232.1 chemotaxis protein methyltransferase CheR [Sphingobium xanthum]
MTMQPVSNAACRLAELLHRETGQTLSEARRWRIETSLRPLLRAHGLRTLEELVNAIDRAPHGLLQAEVIDALLNHESSFFRDVSVFHAIENSVLPALARTRADRRLRIWCGGCSTGQEAYSLAMIVHRSAALADCTVSIHATDVSALAIAKAKRGRFSQMDMQRGLPISELLRWFHPVDNEWQIAGELQQMIVFQQDNLLDPVHGAGPFDLILCRNVLFYFSEERRRRAWKTLSGRVRPGGYLALGAGEMACAESGFSACRGLSCLYQAREARPDQPRMMLPAGGASSAPAIELGQG